MTIETLISILATLPAGASIPIIRGRRIPEIFASIPISAGEIPAGWQRAYEPKGYYPAGTMRVKYIGE